MTPKCARASAEDPYPMRFYSVLGAIRSVLQENPEVYMVNADA
jgi:oxalyl-CoA decarboxylase